MQTTLDALDDAIEMLSELNTGKRTGASRRGRIDLAALLCEIAPSARIAIEPGAGTEVFGDEADLRRMLGVLLSGGSSAPVEGAEIRIRRQDSWIKISVDFGPEVTGGELERRWLSRMATRHGGWLELEGGTQSIFLQADGASDQQEVSQLKKELAEAQELGQAYARELASMLSAGDLATEPPASVLPERTARLAELSATAMALERILVPLTAALREDARSATPGELGATLSRRAHILGQLGEDLGRMAAAQLDEPMTRLDLAPAVQVAVTSLEPRALRQDVTVEVDVPDLAVRASPPQLDLLLWMLLAHAVAATPQGKSVSVRAFSTELGVALVVADAGPQIPVPLRESIRQQKVDPSSVGRPGGVTLLAADAAAAALGSTLELRDGAGGTAECWVMLQTA